MIDGSGSKESTVEKVMEAGFREVLLIPFMLVAGNHFFQDLAGIDNRSWKNAFEEKKIAVTLWRKGLGFSPAIIDIFLQHIKEAIDVIPPRASEKTFESPLASYHGIERRMTL